MNAFFKLFFIGLILSLVTEQKLLAQDTLPAQLAQHQLDAYNQRDLEEFLEPFADSVKLYDFPNELIYKGKENMRKDFRRLFNETPDLHCTLMNRVVFGQTVIDQEHVSLGKEIPPIEVMVIYRIAGNKIIEMYFIKKEETEEADE